MSGPRVLVATSIYPTSELPGRGSYVKTQVEALRELGLHVDVFVLPDSQGSRLRGAQYLSGARTLRRELRGDYDIVHAHYSYVGVIARLQLLLPLVVTYHGSDLLGSVVDGSGHHSLLGALAVRVGRLLGRVIDAAIVQSEEMASKLAARKRVHVIPHEVDLELFRPIERAIARRRLDLRGDGRYILFAADPTVEVKRYSLAEAAVGRLAQQGIEAEILVRYREPQDRLAEYMSACDALVLTSFQEGSPNVVKQAMACNMPIVSTDVGDVRMMIESTAGCYVCPADADAISSRLAELVQAPRRTEGRSAMGHLTKPLVAQRIAAVYDDVLARRTAASERPLARRAW